jgi:hypothetical protein
MIKLNFANWFRQSKETRRRQQKEELGGMKRVREREIY